MRLPDPEQSSAVLIGVSEYRDPNLPDLPAVANNVADLAKVLTDQQLGAFQAERCTVLLDPADQRVVGRALMAASRQAKDVFLVYYAGHGLTGPRLHELYLSLADTDSADTLSYSALRFDGVREAFIASAAANRVLVLDCCYSGRAIEEHMADAASLVMGQIDVVGTYTLTSAPANSVAFAPKGAPHTAFTGHLLKLLRDGVPTGPELLTLGELYLRLNQVMRARGLPLPQQRGTRTADRLALARNAAYSLSLVDLFETPVGNWEWNTATGECIWSATLYRLFGVEPSTEVTYTDYLSLVHPDDRAWVDERWQELARTGRSVECEHRAVLQDGSRKVFHCRGESLDAATGRPVVVGTVRDVTEQRSTENRMMRSSQRFSDLVAIAPVGIGLFDGAERLVDANDALCTLLQMDLERLRGTALADLTHPIDRGELLANVSSRHSRARQRVLVAASGTAVYCELNVTVSVADDGQRFWLVMFTDVTERRRASERLRYQAVHDELTGLLGRSAINQLLDQLLGAPDASQVALLLCDVDNFKRVNDSLGHDVGDEVIIALARRLERGLPPSCTVGRMSGDEYVVICADVSEVGGVEALANRVAQLLRALVPIRGQLLGLSARVGAAMPAEPGTSAADLLRYADTALSKAKLLGPGRVAVADAASIASATSQMPFEGELRDAIANDGLVPHYQPVVGPDGTVLSAEALIRWPHPVRGLLTPREFFRVAVEGDLLRQLDRWMLHNAMSEAAKWPMLAGGVVGGAVSVAVNLSGLAPGDLEFVDVVTAAVVMSGIDWDRVVLELVGTKLVDLSRNARAAMAELSSRGVRFAVDDFGVGYSSLTRLKELPAQIIKLDRQFVTGIASEASDFAVAKAVVEMAHAVGRDCFAEGVETASQFHVLRGFGVEGYQGSLLSPPMPAGEFRELLRLGPVPVPRG